MWSRFHSLCPINGQTHEIYMGVEIESRLLSVELASPDDSSTSQARILSSHGTPCSCKP